MTGPALSGRFFETTRGRIVALLRRSVRTVEELATELELSDNAVRSHLSTLERDGLIRQQGVRRGPGAGKPATVFEIHPDAEPVFSRAYAPMLLAMLAELAARLPVEASPEIMRSAGRRLARSLGIAPPANPSRGVQAALNTLAALGGEAVADQGRGLTTIRGCTTCPLAAVVTGHPDLCCAIETLLAEVTGAAVTSTCEHGEHPRCRFEVRAVA